MQYSIGSIQFLSLSGRPVLPALKLEAQIRPGVDGVGIWEVGIRGEPFFLESVDDAEDTAYAEQMAEDYRDLIQQNGLEVWIADWIFGYLFQVLSVEILEIAAVLTASGGRHCPSTAIIRARWQLIALEQT